MWAAASLLTAPSPPPLAVPASREFELSKDPKTNRVVQGEELASSLQAARLRQLVVGLAAPRYAAPDPTQPDPTPAGMNSEQAAGVRRVSSAQDYTLVLGMPGAGKTTTIVSMVQVGPGWQKREGVAAVQWPTRADEFGGSGGVPPAAERTGSRACERPVPRA